VRVPAVYPAKGRTIRKLIGGRGGRGRKKYIELGKFKRKKSKQHAKKPKKYLCISLKNSYKGNFKEKNSCGSKIPHPSPPPYPIPHLAFKMVRS